MTELGRKRQEESTSPSSVGEDDPRIRATVICLTGLPASGKSSLARRLKERLSSANDDDEEEEEEEDDDHHHHHGQGNCQRQRKRQRRRLIHIEYDDVEDSLAGKAATGKEGGEDDNVHQEDTTYRRREVWNQARDVAVERLQQELEILGDNKADVVPGWHTVILMDDNFHLRGMRKQIHRLLLKYRPIRFGVLWLSTSLDTCIERNRNRVRKVPESVITKMHETFEPPKAAWEASFLSILESTSLSEIVEFVEHCPEIVDLPEEPDAEQQAADRIITLENKAHNFDQQLRSWVGQVAKFDKKFAKSANDSRKKLMLLLKTGSLEINDIGHLRKAFLECIVPANDAEDSSVCTSSGNDIRSQLLALLTENT
jgi:tRNA uridine 5-carbamoylmethylation protein Kti12